MKQTIGGALLSAAVILVMPGLALSQEADGEILVVRPADAADETELSKIPDTPTSRSALTARESTLDLRPAINTGTVFKHGYYRGVVPGSNHIPPRARKLKRTKRNFVTWPGFDATGGGRFFIQSTRPITYERADEQGRIVIVLRKTRINLRNNRNPLVTEHFNTPVANAYLRLRGRDTLLILEMKVDSSPSIRQVSEHNYHFLFVEFPSGNYPIPQGVRRGYQMKGAPARGPLR